jgi:hypothetical protein
MSETTTLTEFTKDQFVAGLCAGIAILEKWAASPEQICSVLQVSRSTYTRAKLRAAEWSVALDSDQMQRISFVLNIHAALRLIFDNPKNVYGFVSMANHNDFFNGRSPLEIMAQGDIESLSETFRRVDAMFRHGLGDHLHKNPCLDEMIKQCNLDSPLSNESRAWEAAPAVGLEYGAEALLSEVSTHTQEKPDPAAVLAKAVLNASTQLGLKQADLAAMLGMHRSSVSRLTELDPASKQGEMALLLVRIACALFALTGGDKDWIAHFMSTPNKTTDGTPAEQITSTEGLHTVLKCVEAIRSKG